MTAFRSVEDLLHDARDAYGRRDWRAAYDAFVSADGLGPMTMGTSTPTPDVPGGWVTSKRLSGSRNGCTSSWCAAIRRLRR